MLCSAEKINVEFFSQREKVMTCSSMAKLGEYGYGLCPRKVLKSTASETGFPDHMME